MSFSSKFSPYTGSGGSGAVGGSWRGSTSYLPTAPSSSSSTGPSTSSHHRSSSTRERPYLSRDYSQPSSFATNAYRTRSMNSLTGSSSSASNGSSYKYNGRDYVSDYRTRPSTLGRLTDTYRSPSSTNLNSSSKSSSTSVPSSTSRLRPAASMSSLSQPISSNYYYNRYQPTNYRPTSPTSSTTSSYRGRDSLKSTQTKSLDEKTASTSELVFFEKNYKKLYEMLLNEVEQFRVGAAAKESIRNREKRTQTRKISELEEEISRKEKLRETNLRLRDENKALLRVVSKLAK